MLLLLLSCFIVVIKYPYNYQSIISSYQVPLSCPKLLIMSTSFLPYIPIFLLLQLHTNDGTLCPQFLASMISLPFSFLLDPSWSTCSSPIVRRLWNCPFNSGLLMPAWRAGFFSQIRSLLDAPRFTPAPLEASVTLITEADILSTI